MSQSKPSIPFVLIAPKNEGIALSWGFTTFKTEDESGKFSCYIPAFDIYFSAKDQATIDKKSKVLTRMFFDHYVLHTGKGGLKNLVLQLHKLGFRAPNDGDTIQQFFKNKVIRAKFKNQVPSELGAFSKGSPMIHEERMEVAI
jgi:hypothetical protein